jgi:prepilin-type N-terminal cleavage/methylation domain-containing protein
MKLSISKMKKQVQRGFTLVEIAIVLVIIGLLIGGVLRGQELINSARVNSISAQQSSIQTAYYGFIDRYKMLPGDLTGPQALLINSTTAPASAYGDGAVLLADSPAFFNNLAQAGFISCTPCSATSLVTPGIPGVAAAAATVAVYITPTTLSGANTMVNVYGAPLAFTTSVAFFGGSAPGSIEFLSATAEISRPMLTTGNSITSNMLAELDRKSDDGNPAIGSFRYTDTGTTTIGTPKVSAAVSMACWNGSAAAGFTWVVNPPGNCQAAHLF